MKAAGSLYKYSERSFPAEDQFNLGGCCHVLVVHEASGGRPEGLDAEATES